MAIEEHEIDFNAGRRGNVTVDPLSSALSVEKPEIVSVLDCRAGEHVDVKALIEKHRYETIIQLRNEVRDQLNENPRFRCSVCSVPVCIASNTHKRFFFKHQIEDGSCPAQTRNSLSRDEIEARKYHGLRESEPHRRIKELIFRSVSADPAFSEPKVESSWRSSHYPSARRQPDVQATGPMGRVAFEVQLSTTFLDVVVARRAFYRQEQAILVWVMGNFDPDYRRLTTDDLLFSNNSNIFVVDEETTSRSVSAGKFHVRCHYRRPFRDGEELRDAWESSVVPFDTLTCETDSQRCWHFDYDGEAGKIRAEVAAELEERDRVETEELQRELFSFWLGRKPYTEADDAALQQWGDLQRRLAARGIPMPHTPDTSNSFIALMNGLSSAREGRPVGWKFKNLVEVAHKIADRYPEHIAAFGFAVRFFDRTGMLDQQDRSQKWKRRAAKIARSLRNGGPDFQPDMEYIGLIGFIVPGSPEKLLALTKRLPY